MPRCWTSSIETSDPRRPRRRPMRRRRPSRQAHPRRNLDGISKSCSSKSVLLFPVEERLRHAVEHRNPERQDFDEQPPHVRGSDRVGYRALPRGGSTARIRILPMNMRRAALSFAFASAMAVAVSVALRLARHPGAWPPLDRLTAFAVHDSWVYILLPATALALITVRRLPSTVASAGSPDRLAGLAVRDARPAPHPVRRKIPRVDVS